STSLFSSALSISSAVSALMPPTSRLRSRPPRPIAWVIPSPASSGFICGLYTGGTLAAEAAGLLAGHLGVEADDAHHHGMML
ncbi:hypothetical protein ACSLNT_30150, partial [Escherichia coli]|uniref:hypothetical protein n=1 Tax=Escherichia coli TaxID=562 RepID=UPI003EE36343